jgi:hypothetical protein
VNATFGTGGTWLDPLLPLAALGIIVIFTRRQEMF